MSQQIPWNFEVIRENPFKLLKFSAKSVIGSGRVTLADSEARLWIEKVSLIFPKLKLCQGF
jgi:hypothetical protein